MKNFCLILLSGCTLVLLTACDLSSTSGEDLLADLQSQVDAAGAAPADAAAPPARTAEPTPAPTGVNGYGGFLWKPVSESSGNLVILTPHASTYGKTEGVATVSGSFGTESANMRHEIHNGYRPHFYFSRPGSAYGRNITVTVPLKDGTVFTQVVPNGSQRFE